jgi:hypothetical protein
MIARFLLERGLLFRELGFADMIIYIINFDMPVDSDSLLLLK